MDIIWRSRPELAMALSAKPSMSGHTRNVRQSWADDAKPDRMIVGRESGSARHARGGRAGYAICRSKMLPLNVQNDMHGNQLSISKPALHAYASRTAGCSEGKRCTARHRIQVRAASVQA